MSYARRTTVRRAAQARTRCARPRALGVLEFLWDRCSRADEGMYHCYDEGARAPGLLIDQARMVIALVQGFRIQLDEAR